MNLLKKLLDSKKHVILDGAMGTELQRMGIKTTLPLWSATALIENPIVIQQIHQDYIRAGAEIITTNTFRTQRHVLEKSGMGAKSDFYTKLACECAKKAIKGRDVLIAGSMSPLEDCYEPALVPDENVLRLNHTMHSKALAEGDADFIFLETMNCIREARIAAEAARKTGLEIGVSFVCNKNGLLSGESLRDAIESVEEFKPAVISVNCSSVDVIDLHIKDLLKYSPSYAGAYANGKGKPSNNCGWQFSDNMSIEKFFLYAKKWTNCGVKLIGGCCGTSPEYIEELSKMISTISASN